MLIAIAVASFVVVALLTRHIARSTHHNTAVEDPRNHQIRQLEADLRTVKRQCQVNEQALSARNIEFEQMVSTVQELRASLVDRDNMIADLQGNLQGEVKNTRELRQELQDKATETIREYIRAQEAETELEVARAGSEAVLSEINRLQEQRKNLTDTMRHLEEALLPDEALLAEGADENR